MNDKISTNITERLPAEKAEMLAKKLFDYTVNDRLLIAPSKKSHQRNRLNKDFTHDNSAPKPSRPDSTARYISTDKNGFLRRTKDDSRLSYRDIEGYERIEHDRYSQSRIEYRSPASDARHDLCVLLTLSAIYCSVGEAMKDDIIPNNTAKAEVDSKIAALKHFQTSSSLMPDLRRIAGDDDALLTHVNALEESIIKAAHSGSLKQPDLSSRNL